jgi:hypothetical protein
VRPTTRLPFIFCPAVALVLAAGCGRATLRWHPSLASHVPDGTAVRFAPAPRDPRIAGRALGWQRGMPRLITPRGDTVLIPRGARLEVRLRDKTNLAVAGGVVGFTVGVGVMYANCPGSAKTCPEQNPTPYIIAGLGALLGSVIKVAHWAAVAWDAP